MFFRGQTVGKYRILSPLGSGGFGSVYLATDTWIDKQVAIKVPHRQNLDFTELLKEPRLLASMSHPNIVTILTAEKHDDVFFIVMEYVAGETLEALIEREGSLDLTRALDYTCQIANAMDHNDQRAKKNEENSGGGWVTTIISILVFPAVIFGLMPLMLLTGLTMSPAVYARLPLLGDLLGGRQSARTLHFLAASGLVAFFAVHIAMVVAAGPLNEVRSMITGWFVIRREKVKP